MILGIDMGGTNTRMGLVDAAMGLIGPCRVLPSRVFAEAPEAHAPAAIEDVKAALDHDVSVSASIRLWLEKYRA